MVTPFLQSSFTKNCLTSWSNRSSSDLNHSSKPPESKGSFRYALIKSQRHAAGLKLQDPHRSICSHVLVHPLGTAGPSVGITSQPVGGRDGHITTSLKPSGARPRTRAPRARLQQVGRHEESRHVAATVDQNRSRTGDQLQVHPAGRFIGKSTNSCTAEELRVSNGQLGVSCSGNFGCEAIHLLSESS